MKDLRKVWYWVDTIGKGLTFAAGACYGVSISHLSWESSFKEISVLFPVALFLVMAALAYALSSTMRDMEL